jgi:hypothetical protein
MKRCFDRSDSEYIARVLAHPARIVILFEIRILRPWGYY